MVRALDSESSDLSRFKPWMGKCVVSWARHLTLVDPFLSSPWCINEYRQSYCWEGVTLRWTSIPSGGKVELLLVASCYLTGDKRRPDVLLKSYVDLTFCFLNFLQVKTGT